MVLRPAIVWGDWCPRLSVQLAVKLRGGGWCFEAGSPSPTLCTITELFALHRPGRGLAWSCTYCATVQPGYGIPDSGQGRPQLV